MSFQEERSAENKAMRARVDGRNAVAAKTVWSFEVGGIRLRCLAEATMYVVQIKVDNKWTAVKTGNNAEALLNKIINSGGITKAFASLPNLGVK